MYVVKDSSETIYVSFRDPGQILKIRDCPGDSRTVGPYGLEFNPSVSATYHWRGLAQRENVIYLYNMYSSNKQIQDVSARRPLSAEDD